VPTIWELKEQPVTETPLVLFDCELPNGAFERWSTHAVSVGGHDYQPRVLRHNVFETRWSSEDGIDSISRVTLTLANVDSYLSQIEQSVGWKGSKLTVRFQFFNLREGVAASEAMVLFRGLLNPPDEVTESELRLSAHNRLGMQRFQLPEIRIQRRCPWSFPSTAEERASAVDGGVRGKYSPLYRCGYSPDQPSGLGNFNGAVPFSSCDYTRASCEQRGMFDTDSANRVTRRFGGVEFLPASILVRGFGDVTVRTSEAAENETRYNDVVPLYYGTVWTQPPAIFASNDGNLTRVEVLLGAGEIHRVLKVIVNGIEIPQGVAGANMTATGWFNVVSHGAVTGGFNLDFTNSSGQPLGDPYGSMAFLAVSVPNRVSDGRSVPKVQVLLEGLKLPVFDAAGSFLGETFSNNPAWVILDLLRRSGWTLDEIDLPSFAGCAAYCAEPLTVTDLFGNPKMAPRFQCNLAVRRRRSVAELIRGVRNASRLYLTYGATGLLEMRVEGSLAVQQPSKPAGSNSTSPLNGGWPAYEFGDGTDGRTGIVRRDNGESSMRLSYLSTAESPNRASVEFQDEFNEFQQDSLSLVDTEDAVRARQEVSVTSTALGIANFHQAARVLRLLLDKSIRGNLRISFETSVRGVGLRPGDIITVTYLKEGMERRPFRITRIVPALNHATALIEAQAHSDSWYTDDPGMAAGSRVSRRSPEGNVGIPRPLSGTIQHPDLGTQFEVEEQALPEGDGGSSVVLSVAFTTPPKPSSLGVSIPYLSLSPIIDTAGGALAGGRNLYYAVTAVDADGEESEPSFAVLASIPPTTNTNRVTLQSLSFSPTTSSFHVYRGVNPRQMYRIASHQPVAASFQDSGLAAGVGVPPDEDFDHARFEWRTELHPEVNATLFSAVTIGSNALSLTPDEFAGMAVRITAGKGLGQERVILSHSATTLTVEPAWSDTPDSSSRFVIAEPSWTAGATARTSPVRFAVPNRPGMTVQIVGLAVNALGRDCGRDLSPLTRWTIGGGAGSLLDSDVPPEPVFGLQVAGEGNVELIGVSFSSLVNTRTIQAGTLRLHFWDEFSGPAPLSLAAAVDAAGTSVEIAGGPPPAVGQRIQVESEVMEVVSVAGSVLGVERGVLGSAAAPHPAGKSVHVLEERVFIVPFARDFFGSPASGSFAFPIFLPDVRVAAAEMFMTNSRGNGQTRRVAFTATADQGLRTLSGGQISIQVEGPLAIQDDAAPPFVVENSHSVRDIFAMVGEAPVGAPVQMRLRQNSTVYCELTIPAGATISNVVGGFGLPPLAAMSTLSLDITSVGQGAETTPGRDLSVTIRL